MKIQLSRFEKAEIVVKTLDPSLRKSDSAFRVAVILVVMLGAGTDFSIIQNLVPYSRKFCNDVFVRLLDNGIVTNDGVLHGNWFDRETGGIAFWMDVNVGLGFMKRSK